MNNNIDLMINDLVAYLYNKQKPEVVNYIISLFEKLNDNYDKHLWATPWAIDKEKYIKQHVDTIKKLNNLVFVRNINENSYYGNYFRGNIVRNINHYYLFNRGYTRNNGYYYPTKCYPTHYCSTEGVAKPFKKEIAILYDDTVISNNALFHELIHINQTGFDLPSNILNRDIFIHVLKEGHAIHESKYINDGITISEDISYSMFNRKYYKNESLNYNIYLYIYSKLYILLGLQLMDYWATHANGDELTMAIMVIDKKYGEGSFKRLYKNIQLMLFGIQNISIEEINDLINKELKHKSQNSINDSLVNSYNQVLNNELLFELAYQNNDEFPCTQYTKEEFRTEVLKKLRKYSNEKKLDMISDANIEILNIIKNSSNYLNKAINDIEQQVEDYLQKDLLDKSQNHILNIKKHEYYSRVLDIND
jgi:hypothetical protein